MAKPLDETMAEIAGRWEILLPTVNLHRYSNQLPRSRRPIVSSETRYMRGLNQWALSEVTRGSTELPPRAPDLPCPGPGGTVLPFWPPSPIIIPVSALFCDVAKSSHRPRCVNGSCWRDDGENSHGIYNCCAEWNERTTTSAVGARSATASFCAT
jgi:hypothetical protein